MSGANLKTCFHLILREKKYSFLFVLPLGNVTQDVKKSLPLIIETKVFCKRARLQNKGNYKNFSLVKQITTFTVQ